MYSLMSLFRVLGVFSSIILVILFIIAKIKSNIIRNEIKEIEKDIEKNENNNELAEKLTIAKNKKVKINKRAIFYIVVAIILFYVSQVPSLIYDKPIIYLYPETEQEISVELGYPENLICTYPKYENKWIVNAKPNGDLTDIKTGRNIYALYWEGTNNKKGKKIKEGFCIKGDDSAKFLEEKLAILGLNDRETEEFIVYWLPKLENNKYNLIRFETKEEIDEAMPLNISPKPDTLIRVMMEFKASNKYVELKEQKLITPERKGFTVVEWGGTDL